ncbi:MAG: helix-turn-helix transcriptional regulator [Elusimicrobiota bacterium]
MYKRFNNAVLTGLKERNISLRELCRASGIDASFLSKVLKNKRNPPSDEKILTKMATALGIEPVKLIVYTGKIPEKYYELFCNDRFIENLAAGNKTPEKLPGPARKKQMPAPAPRIQQKKIEISEELL